MPRFRVTEERSFRRVMLVEAEDEAAAGRMDCEILAEEDGYSEPQQIEAIERVADDEDSL